jgi:hypothetical protein
LLRVLVMSMINEVPSYCRLWLLDMVIGDYRKWEQVSSLRKRLGKIFILKIHEW